MGGENGLSILHTQGENQLPILIDKKVLPAGIVGQRGSAADGKQGSGQVTGLIHIGGAAFRIKTHPAGGADQQVGAKKGEGAAAAAGIAEGFHLTAFVSFQRAVGKIAADKVKVQLLPVGNEKKSGQRQRRSYEECEHPVEKGPFLVVIHPVSSPLG